MKVIREAESWTPVVGVVLQLLAPTVLDRLQLTLDVIRSDCEVIAHAEHLRRPREIVLELTLQLGGRLRGVDALSNRDARWIDDRRVCRIGRDQVLEVRVLEQELIQLVRAYLPGVS